MRRLRALRVAVSAWLAVLCGCAQPQLSPSAIQTQAIPAGMARIWVYREYEPYETLGRPYIRLNGGVVGISEPGGVLFRDVPPGSYTVTADTVGRDVNQFVNVALAAGQSAFVKIESASLWESDLNYRADTFYTRAIPSDIAATELARQRFHFGG